MSGIEELKAAKVIAPTGDGVNNSSQRYLPLSTTATSIALPDEWKGGYVTLKAITADAYFFISEQVATLPDAGKTAADKQLGWPLLAGTSESYRLPECSRGGTLYLCADGSATGALYVRLSSETK